MFTRVATRAAEYCIHRPDIEVYGRTFGFLSLMSLKTLNSSEEVAYISLSRVIGNSRTRLPQAL